MDKMDIAKRLQEEARKDRVKLIAGAAVMAAASMGFTHIAVDYITSTLVTRAAILLFTGGIYGTAVFLILRLIRKMEHDSFGEGMHIVMECAPMAVSLLDRDAKLAYCNERAPKLFGLRDRDEYRRKYLECVPATQPDGRNSMDVVKTHMKAALRGGQETFGFVQREPRGVEVPVEITYASAYFDGAVHLLEFTRDLREEHAAKKKEEEFKKRSQAIMDASPLLCVLYDEQGNALFVSKEAENLFNIPDRALFAKDFNSFLPARQPDGSDSIQKNLDVMKQTLRDGQLNVEWMYQRKDGTPIPTEEINQRITVDGQNLVIAYSRDLREYYKEREKEKLVQERIQAMAEELSKNVSEQAAAVTESSAAIEEMIANIGSVTTTLSRNTENVRGLQEASGVGHTGLSGVAADLQEIARESESLTEINSVMQNIASQTNLLSMNAAIEAAHAGELGMGFAVVANEIRKLAESSAVQSKTISSVLKKIKGSIDKITKSTNGVLGKFDAIDSGVRTVAQQEDNILNAMEEQGQGSKQILLAIGQLNEITQRVKDEARHMVERSKVEV